MSDQGVGCILCDLKRIPEMYLLRNLHSTTVKVNLFLAVQEAETKSSRIDGLMRLVKAFIAAFYQQASRFCETFSAFSHQLCLLHSL